MMAEQEPGKFRLGKDEDLEGPGPTLPEVESGERVGGKRVSTGFYIIMAIVVVAMLAAYFDLYRRVDRSRSIGSNQIENLDNRLSKLADQLNALKEQLSQQLVDGQTAIKTIEEQLIKEYEALKATVATKANKSDLNTSIATVQKEMKRMGAETGMALEKLDGMATRLETIKRLDTGLETLETNISKMKDDLSSDMEEIILQLDKSSKNLIELKSRTDRLAADKIDQKTADNLIKKRLQAQQPPSEQVSKTLLDQGTEIESLKRQMVDLIKNTTIYENEILKMKRQLKSLESGLTNKRSKITRPPSTTTPSSAQSVKSGDLLQQTLKE